MKFQQKIRYALFVALLTIFVGSDLQIFAQTLVCRKQYETGFFDVYQRGERRLGNPTPMVELMEVFVTTKGDNLYIHTNYKPAGWDYPWKLTTNEDVGDLRFWISYLTNPEAFRNRNNDNAAWRFHDDRVLFSYLSNMKIVVEERLLKHPKFKDLDFGSAANVKIIGSDGIARKTTTIERSNGSKQRIVELAPNRIYADMKSPDAMGMMKRFNSKPFRRNDVKVLSLVQDQTTTSKVEELIPSRNRVTFDFSSAENLRNEFSRHRGNTVFVIGHIPEGSGRVVVENAAQQEVFSISIRELETMAKDNNSSVIILGCKSAGKAEEGGVINELRSIVAVERLGDAMNARNYGEFVSRLASPDLMFVADEALLEGANRRITLTPGRAVTVGAITTAVGIAGGLIISEILEDDTRRNWRQRNNNRRNRNARRTNNGN